MSWLWRVGPPLLAGVFACTTGAIAVLGWVSGKVAVFSKSCSGHCFESLAESPKDYWFNEGSWIVATAFFVGLVVWMVVGARRR